MTGAESITNFERYRLDELRVGVRIVYEVAANWKIVVENYNECLHCPTIHPELVAVVPLYRFGEVWDEETRDDGNWMIEGATSFTRTGKLDPAARSRTCCPRTTACTTGRYQFPNLMLNLHPDAAMSYTALPKRTGPHDDRVRVPVPARDDRRGPTSPRSPSSSCGTSSRKQDWNVCERAQTGVSSRVLPDRGVPAQGPLPVRLQRALPPGDGPAHARLSVRGASVTHL